MSEASEPENGVPSPTKSVTEYLAYLQSQIQPLTRTAAQLPGPSDLSFHRSLDRSLLKDLDTTKDDILSTLNALLGSISSKAINGKGKSAVDDAWELKADDLIDANGFSRKLGDIVDTLIERADTKLDEYQGKVKPTSETSKTRGEKAGTGEKIGSVPAIGPLPSYLLNANIQPLPQLKFSRQPDNSRDRLWKHTLTEKPHAKVPLTWRAPEPGLDETAPIVGTRQGMYCAEGDPRDNPYHFEINQYSPPDFSVDALPRVDTLVPPSPLQKADPTSGPIPFSWVDDEATFEALFEHLMEERVKEVAIDVEHHNYRSFQGLVCLVQISTRWQDFIIDALSPEIRNISSRLNQVFTNENKVKILHGAEHDILWLQRDLGLYIVGLFDTYHATNVLNFPQHSLAFLLTRYVEFEADKRYQLADWRIRPLNKEMMFYARSDTHSLIYIYDCLRFEIAKKEGTDGIKKVFELSKRTANKTYAKEEWDSAGEGREGWRSLWKRMGGMDSVGVDERWEKEGLDGLNKTERIFRALHDWRDQMARNEDESARYILPTNNLLNLSSRAPQTQEAVLPCVGPAFKKRASDVASLIKLECDAFEESQKKKGEREKAKLKSMQNDSADEEIGEVVSYYGNSNPQKLWPASDEGGTSARGPSTIASLLFGRSKPKPNDETPTQNSLFAPLPRTLTNLKVLTGIKTELTSALNGILGNNVGGAKEVNSEGERDINHNTTKLEPETVPFVAKRDRLAVTEANNVSSSSQANLATPGSLQAEKIDDVLKVKKDSKAKKREASDDRASSTKSEKKPKWTKEQKEQRRREREDKEYLASAAIEPFDYSKAKSVLDSKPAVPVKDEGRVQKKKDKKEKDKKTSRTSSGATDEKGRYANISVRRDRKEQQGGKSMSFSQ